MLSCSRAAARQALRAVALTHGQQAGRRGLAAVSTYHSSSAVASSSRYPSTTTTSTQAVGRRRTYQKRESNGSEHEDRRRGDVVPGERPLADFRMKAPAAEDITSVQRWLRSSFPAFSFPDEMALRLITHESYDHGKEAGHNRRLAFIGRRSMEFYMNLFLAQHPGNEALMNSLVIDDLLHTSMLGDHVGRALRLAEVMRWTPAFSDGQSGAKAMGLFKIRGVAVEALAGAIYHQYGAQTARHFFSAYILPNLSTFSGEDAERLKKDIAAEQRKGLAYLAALSEGAGVSQTSAVDQQAAIAAASGAPARTSPLSAQTDDELMDDYARHATQRHATEPASARP